MTGLSRRILAALLLLLWTGAATIDRRGINHASSRRRQTSSKCMNANGRTCAQLLGTVRKRQAEHSYRALFVADIS
jgi:hypothetical protein